MKDDEKGLWFVGITAVIFGLIWIGLLMYEMLGRHG